MNNNNKTKNHLFQFPVKMSMLWEEKEKSELQFRKTQLGGGGTGL